MRAVTYTKQVTFELTDAEFDVIKDLYRSNLKVTAIKFIKMQYTLGLKDAKDICDSIGHAQIFS